MVADWESVWIEKAKKTTKKQIENSEYIKRDFRINETQGNIFAFPFINWLTLDVLLPLF